MWLPFRRGRMRPVELDPQTARVPAATAQYVAIDCELTGLDGRRDSILSLGGVWITGGRIDLQHAFYQEVRPLSTLSADGIVVHGITPDDLREKPAIESVLAGFVAFCNRGIIVGHFIGIDLEFLAKELSRLPGVVLAKPAIDTAVLYEHLAGCPPRDGGPELPRLRDPRLYELARVLGVECRGGHNAFSDAFITAQVFQRLLRLAPRWGILTTGDLVRAGDPLCTRERRPGSDPPLA